MSENARREGIANRLGQRLRDSLEALGQVVGSELDFDVRPFLDSAADHVEGRECRQLDVRSRAARGLGCEWSARVGFVGVSSSEARPASDSGSCRPKSLVRVRGGRIYRHGCAEHAAYRVARPRGACNGYRNAGFSDDVRHGFPFGNTARLRSEGMEGRAEKWNGVEAEVRGPVGYRCFRMAVRWACGPDYGKRVIIRDRLKMQRTEGLTDTTSDNGRGRARS